MTSWLLNSILEFRTILNEIVKPVVLKGSFIYNVHFLKAFLAKLKNDTVIVIEIWKCVV